MNTTPGIYGFFNEHHFLSNFYPAMVEFEGIEYRSVEHAYQAAKTLDQSQRVYISNLVTPGLSKKAGRRVDLRSDWEDVKVYIMHQLVRQKFFKHPELAKMLYDTGDLYLEETNYWNDRFWGVCKGVGKNQLGIILMNVCEEINNKITGSLAQR